MIAAIVTGIVALIVIAWLCFRLSALHRKFADLNQLVADLLSAPTRSAQERLAQSFIDRDKTAIRGL